MPFTAIQVTLQIPTASFQIAGSPVLPLMQSNFPSLGGHDSLQHRQQALRRAVDSAIESQPCYCARDWLYATRKADEEEGRAGEGSPTVPMGRREVK